MNIGVGLPNTVPGTSAEQLAEWAHRADAGPFTSVAVLDRVVYESVDPFAALSAAAAATQRVALATMVAIGPLRSNAALATEAASVDSLSGGRLVLGLGIGARTDDYTASGVPTRARGARLSEQLAYLRGASPGGVAVRDDLQLLVGGGSGPAFARMARYADGYAHNGGPPRAFARAAAAARAAWSDYGRPRAPRLWGQAYFALGDAADAGRAYLRDYYAFTGPFAERIAAGCLTTPGAVRDLIRGYADAGCDELVVFATVPDPEQVDRLAEAVAG